jgi:hypothetical protein
VVELAQERGVTKGRKMRVDTTVVESNIHYPTVYRPIRGGQQSRRFILI